MKHILLIPAMLDAHFPIMKYAFCSKNYEPVILENEEDITNIGLKYVNNDMCYPCILNTGQIIGALQSNEYDVTKTQILMPTAGDACRGANYTGVIRRAVAHAGFPEVPVLSLNVRGLEREAQMKVNPKMVWKALLSLYYGDILMLLLNQTRPYEKKSGDATKVWQKWVDILTRDMQSNRHLTLGRMKRNFDLIAQDFAKLDLIKEKKQRVGIVGELYIKYCHIGNWNMIKTIEEAGCESHTNGLSWYAIYYIDSHLTELGRGMGMLYRIALRFFSGLQRDMIGAIRRNGFYSMEEFAIMKKEAAQYMEFHQTVGDGWLIGAETIGHILHDCPKVVAVQPFGCMPNHVCGRGLYPALARRLPQGNIVSVDVDSGGSRLNVKNRVLMLLHVNKTVRKESTEDKKREE